MNEELVSQVEDLGLSQKEARVYVANLALGPASVQHIADFSGIKRVTTYVILESLANLGLVSQSTKAKKTFFSAEEPNNLLRLLEKKEQELKEQRTGFEAILPALKSLKNQPSEPPEVRYYEGIEGIRSIAENFKHFWDEADTKTVYGISNLDHVYHYFPDFKQQRGNMERVKAGVHSKYLYASSEGPILKDSDEASNRESRYVPMDKYPVAGDFSLAGDYVILFSLTGAKPLGITIKSTEVAKAMKAIFDLAWEAAEKYNTR